MPRIAWVNPSFLDYRVSVYSLLNNKTGNSFFILYSKNRVHERVHSKIKKALGNNAISFTDELTLSFGKNTDFANKSLTIPYQKGLIKKLISLKPDVIIAEGFFQWTPAAIFVSQILRSKLFISYERTIHTERNSSVWRTYYRKIVSKFVHGFLINGKETEDYLKTSLGISDKIISKGCMSADSLNLSENSLNFRSSITEYLSLRNFYQPFVNGLLFLFVGQLIERKGVKQLLEVWSKHILKHSNDSLLIVGNGELSNIVIESSLRFPSIKFIGDVDYDVIFKYYSIADVFILPTIEDNWSLVIPEAMACGLPVATTVYNGCHPDLVKEGENGFVFDSLDEESFLWTLDRFHFVDLKQFGLKSIEIESNFTPYFSSERILEGIHQSYNTIP